MLDANGMRRSDVEGLKPPAGRGRGIAIPRETDEALEQRSAVIRAAPAESLMYTKATAPAGAVGMRPPADDFSVTAPQLRVVSASDTTTTASLSRTAGEGAASCWMPC